MYRATISTHLEPDTDSSPLDYLPRDYRAENDYQTDDQFKLSEEDIATAEHSDAELITSWKRDDWRYWGVIVTATIHTTVNGKDFTTEEHESLWSVDDVDPTYPDTVAKELTAELTARLTTDYPGIEITHV